MKKGSLLNVICQRFRFFFVILTSLFCFIHTSQSNSLRPLEYNHILFLCLIGLTWPALAQTNGNGWVAYLNLAVSLPVGLSLCPLYLFPVNRCQWYIHRDRLINHHGRALNELNTHRPLLGSTNTLTEVTYTWSLVTVFYPLYKYISVWIDLLTHLCHRSMDSDP